MNLKLPQLIALVVGGLLIYSAVKDVNAADVIKAVLSGKPIPTGGASLPDRTEVTDESGNPDGYIDSQGRYIPRTDANTEQPQVPDGPRNVPSLYVKPFV